MSARLGLVASLGMALAGCDDDGAAPSSLLTAPRLLAIAADPPVTTASGVIALRALVVGSDGAALDVPVAWRVCSPWTLVRDPDVDCATGLALAVDDAGVAQLEVAAVLARFGGPAGPLPETGPCELGSVPVPVIATARVDGVRLIARKDVGVAQAARRAPAIATVTLDEAAATTFVPGATHRVAATPARDLLDERCTQDAVPVPVRESVRAYFYVSAGELDETSTTVVSQPDGSEAVGSVGFTAPDDRDLVRLWTVLIDGDGGAAWALRELRAR